LISPRAAFAAPFHAMSIVLTFGAQPSLKSKLGD
jgi:hypothetical protein